MKNLKPFQSRRSSFEILFIEKQQQQEEEEEEEK